MKARRRFRREVEGADSQEILVEVRDAARAWVKTADAEVQADFARLPDGRTSVILPSGRQLAGRISHRPGGRVETWVGAHRLAIRLSDPLRDRSESGSQSSGEASEVRAPIPGRVIEVRVAVGDRVTVGTTLIVLEAMKMQNEIRSESAARVARVECVAGDPVEAGALLLWLEPEERANREDQKSSP